MKKISNFFKKISLDNKFKQCGEGRRLNETLPVPESSEAHNSGLPYNAPEPSIGSAKAAEAAMMRMNIKNQKGGGPIRREVKRELEEQQKAEKEANELKDRFTPNILIKDTPNALSRVLFWCPALFGDTVIAPREEVDEAISRYLASEFDSNPAEAAALSLMRGLHRSRPPSSLLSSDTQQQPDPLEWMEKRKSNVLRIIDNLIRSPDNLTYRRLRIGNQLISDLLSVDGVELFLNTCQFKRQLLPVPQASEQTSETEEYLVISEEHAGHTEHLKKMRELFLSAEPILAQLYRDTRVFQVTGANAGIPSDDQLSDDFFYHTKADVKRLMEQHRRTIEESGMLLTKAMRERLKVHEIRLFRYVLIRVRIQGTIIIQGTFNANDKLSVVRSWITDCLADPSMEYQLWAPPGTVSSSSKPLTARVELTDNSMSLVELGLAPCSLLNMNIVNTGKDTSQSKILCSELMSSIQTL